MKKIEQHIFDLLFKHDCVILPGFGGFVADYRSAYTDSKIQKVYPPSKQFIFNRYLTNNDGLLAHELVSSEQCSFEDSMNIIETYVEEVKKALATKRRFEIGRVGVLFVDQQQAIRFKSSPTNFLVNSFGLPVVKAIPVVLAPPVKVEPELKKAVVKPITIVHDQEKILAVDKTEEKVISIRRK